MKLQSVEYAVPVKEQGALCPSPDDLAKLIVDYSNCAIADACMVSETTVRNWLRGLGLARSDRIRRYGESVPDAEIERMKKRRPRRRTRSTNPSRGRVSRIVSAIGEEVGVIVRQPDTERRVRIKYASAHDLRRSLAERLYNRGISAETAAAEIQSILGGDDTDRALVGG